MRSSRCDLNQIPYDYTVEVTNIQGLSLIDTVSEELWTEVCDSVQEAGINTIPEKKKCKKAKWTPRSHMVPDEIIDRETFFNT